jgi:hypothetical protein
LGGLRLFGSQVADGGFRPVDLFIDRAETERNLLLGDFCGTYGVAVGATEEPSPLVHSLEILFGLDEACGCLLAIEGQLGNLVVRRRQLGVESAMSGGLRAQEPDLVSAVRPG